MKFILIGFIFYSSFSFAAEAVSLKQEAIQETAVPATLQRTTASEASQSASMLSLKDPRIEALDRSWKYYFNFSVEKFQPQGSAESSTPNKLQLNQSPAATMLGLGLGTHFTLAETRNVLVSWGIGGQLRYSIQNQAVTLPSGYRVSDAKLSSMLLLGEAYLGFSPENFKTLELQIGPQIGNLNYTQVSSNDFATFSKQAPVAGWKVGMLWAISPQWSALIQQRHLKVTSDSTVEIASEQYEVGVQVLW